ncbi:hypothetical protein CEXT_702671 [Caerostris extrusa]|uniref:Uncharacterized protein n=1 Tax=Caerostris extrusa TaxID=172846 RepID=A0AAV4Y8T9_CAEEX|nr:hypothetical protein CEXT_702671 [Caerostris extrusa]
MIRERPVVVRDNIEPHHTVGISVKELLGSLVLTPLRMDLSVFHTTTSGFSAELLGGDVVVNMDAEEEVGNDSPKITRAYGGTQIFFKNNIVHNEMIPHQLNPIQTTVINVVDNLPGLTVAPVCVLCKINLFIIITTLLA